MKLATSLTAGAAALALLGGTFLLSAVGTHNATGSCGPASATQVAAGESIAGYSGDQLTNAAAIMNAATALRLPERAQVLGVMAAMGESGLRNITYGDWETAGVTNPNGTRTTSIGLFQQQTSWGSTDERLNPTRSATLFFQRLAKLDGWENLPASQAIHRVQINADPNHYSKWETAAEQVTAALTVPCAGPELELAAGPGEWGGYENGKIPTSALARVPWAPEMRLRADAARSLTKLNAAFRQTFGYDLPLNDGYRDYAKQVDAKRIYGSEAAAPGSSNHGWAIAIDVGTYTHMRISFDSATYTWLTTHGPRHGWINPDWAKPGGTGPDEAWHWEYLGAVS